MGKKVAENTISNHVLHRNVHSTFEALGGLAQSIYLQYISIYLQAIVPKYESVI